MAVQLLTITPGQDVVDVLTRFCAERSVWVTASGDVEGADVRVTGDGPPVRRMPGRATLVSLMGPGEGPFTVFLARATQTGAETGSGVLMRAKSMQVHAQVVEVEAVAGPPRARGTADPRPAGWAAVAQASADAESPSQDDDDDDFPETGDQVEHFAFGLCEVLDSDGERLKIRGGTGRVREIRVDMLQIDRPQMRQGVRVFKLNRRAP